MLTSNQPSVRGVTTTDSDLFSLVIRVPSIAAQAEMVYSDGIRQNNGNKGHKALFIAVFNPNGKILPKLV